MSIVTREISSYVDIIDSRDVIARLAELEEMTADSEENLTDDESRELVALRRLAQEGEDLEDWEFGATLIRDSYFTEYARDYAEGLSDMNEMTWPFTHIDWDAAADDLQTDYTDIEFDGVTYWAR